MKRKILGVLSFDFLAKIILGIVSILLIRYMPTGEYATYTLCISAVSVVSQIPINIADRIYLVGHNKFKIYENIGNLLLIQIIMVSFLSIAALIFLQSIKIIVSIFFLSTAYCITQYVKVVQQWELKFKIYSAVEMAKSFLFLVLICGSLLIFSGLNFETVISIQFFAFFISSLPLIFGIFRKKDSISITGSIFLSKAIFESKYKFLMGFVCVGAFLPQINVFLISMMEDGYLVSSYGASFKYFSILNLALSATHVVLLPSIQKAKSQEEINAIFVDMKKFVWLVSPIIIIGSIVSSWLIPLLDGGKYPDSIITFQILSIAALISFWFSPYITILMKYEDFKFLYYIAIIGFVLSMSFGGTLIYFGGVKGAGVAYLLVYSFVNFSIFIRAKKRYFRICLANS